MVYGFNDDKGKVDVLPLTGGVVRGSATFDEIDTMDMSVGNLLVTGAGKVVNGTDYGNSQLRNIFFATAAPASTVGNNGDVCIIYTA